MNNKHINMNNNGFILGIKKNIDNNDISMDI